MGRGAGELEAAGVVAAAAVVVVVVTVVVVAAHSHLRDALPLRPLHVQP